MFLLVFPVLPCLSLYPFLFLSVCEFFGGVVLLLAADSVKDSHLPAVCSSLCPVNTPITHQHIYLRLYLTLLSNHSSPACWLTAHQLSASFAFWEFSLPFVSFATFTFTSTSTSTSVCQPAVPGLSHSPPFHLPPSSQHLFCHQNSTLQKTQLL